jgi:hypothetical protein
VASLEEDASARRSASLRRFHTFAQEHCAAHSHTLADDTTRVGMLPLLDRHKPPTLGTRPVASAIAGAPDGGWSRSVAPGAARNKVLPQVHRCTEQRAQ